MKNIAIMTEKFILWNGGTDFIKQIILALNTVAKENDLNLHIFIPKTPAYKKCKGLKRAFLKIKSFFVHEIKTTNAHGTFPEFTGLNFVEYEPNGLKKALKRFSIDFMLPHMEPKYFKLSIPTIGYIFDCQHKYYPEFFDKKEIRIRNRLFKKFARSDERIIINARSVKRDLIKFYNAKSENIFVLPFTPKVKLEYLEDSSELIKKYNLPKRYFIISNQFWLHKDHSTAFKAFAELIKIPEYNDIKLICTGLMEDNRRPEYIDELKSLIEDLGCKDKIQCLGLIPKLEQIEIMKGSLAVIQPTLFEGGPGGGCVWDAISLGIPSICSDIDTNLEISDKNTFFFKAKDVKDLTSKMEAILMQNFETHPKEKLIAESKKNIEKLGFFMYNLIKEGLT